MDVDIRRSIIDRYMNWSESWGLTLAFAVTQSAEKSEKILADAVVALVATELKISMRMLPPSVHASRFAWVLWEQAGATAFRGYSSDPFFKMPPIARAIVILKTRALFSKSQIAAALHLTEDQVSEHLENARLLFSAGRSWLSQSPEVHFGEDQDPQMLFAQYVGNDLNSDGRQRIQAHLIACEVCRKNFHTFKQNYSEWLSSMPQAVLAPSLKKQLSKMSNQVLTLDRTIPSPWPGMKRVMRQTQVRAVLFGLLSIMIIHHLLH